MGVLRVHVIREVCQPYPSLGGCFQEPDVSEANSRDEATRLLDVYDHLFLPEALSVFTLHLLVSSESLVLHSFVPFLARSSHSAKIRAAFWMSEALWASFFLRSPRPTTNRPPGRKSPRKRS